MAGVGAPGIAERGQEIRRSLAAAAIAGIGHSPFLLLHVSAAFGAGRQQLPFFHIE